MEPSHEPLSKKHRDFNKRVQDAIKTGSPLREKEFSNENHDQINLMKIDIASHNKNVDYILSVLKSDDILYVARAIKQSHWLVDDQYANIINPEFLNEHLFPHMKTKASIKLLKHIRHYLKNESRVEEFLKNEAKKEAAAKWLSRCSVSFIENNINDYIGYVTDLEFKRICERSVTIFEAAVKGGISGNKLKAASFLLHTHSDKYLDAFDNSCRYGKPSFGPTGTRLIMKMDPKRIKNNFFDYFNYIHIPTFVDNLNRGEIKDFLYTIASEDIQEKHQRCYEKLFKYNMLKVFIEKMPKEQQFEFVKNIFFNNDLLTIEEDTLQRGTEMFAIKRIYSNVMHKTHCRQPTSIYNWYVFAPFSIAFDELKKLMQTEPYKNEKYCIYNVLLKCAAANFSDLLELLRHYAENSLNIESRLRKSFMNDVISRPEIYNFDEISWRALTDVVNAMEIYNENNNGLFTEKNLLFYILYNKEITEDMKRIISKKFPEYPRHLLSKEKQDKLFQYFYNFAVNSIQPYDIQTEDMFSEATSKLKSILNLLLYWDKELVDYPLILEKIKDLTKIKTSHSWKSDMSFLYNKKKSWKRLMFEESVVLNPSQNVLVNALKHDPTLITRYKNESEAICYDNGISLKQLHKKLKVYWPDSLTVDWIKSYLDHLNKIENHKVSTRGLCTLLSQKQLLDKLNTYAPAQPKIDWNNIDEHTLSLQRCLAKNMHIARPQPSVDTLLLYAKGDFLQYSLPALLALFYNISFVECQEHIPKLLNAPVSLQKHGLRLAFNRLKHEELKQYLNNIWQTSKNISIRAVTFELLFNLICKEKNSTKIEELWEILEMFIDNLTFKEDKKIYDRLMQVNDVPDTVKPKFLIKSYKFLQNLVPHITIDREKYQDGIQRLVSYTRNIMEFMCPDFVENVINEHLDANFCTWGALENSMLDVTSSYLLCAKDEETQNNKYERVLAPIIKLALNQWNEMYDDKYFVRQNLQNLLRRLYNDLEEKIVSHKMIVPIKMFHNIQKELQALPVPQNYVLLRVWDLVVKITEIIEKNTRESWPQICSDLVPEFGQFCLDTLKNDVKTYFPCIYVIFEKVLRAVESRLDTLAVFNIYEILLSDKEFVKSFLLVISMLNKNCYHANDEVTKKKQELLNAIKDHSSVEVKIHYCFKYKNDSAISLFA